jgi:hypothetical protein
MLTMTNKDTNAWDCIKGIYKKRFNIPEKVVDYVAVQKILHGCVYGLKNTTIAKIAKESPGYVNDVIVEFLHFYGWKETLDINPIVWYNRANGNKKDFTYFCFKESGMMDVNMINTAFEICQTYKRIVEEIGKFYANS